MNITKISRIESESELINEENIMQHNFAYDIEVGLSSRPKKIPSKYFYDDKGSQLFQEITRLQEYYPTRTELENLQSIKEILPDIIDASVIDIVELGVGDGHKTKILIDSFKQKNITVNFYPIDISLEALQLLKNNFSPEDNLTIHGILGEYLQGLRFARKNSHNRQIVLLLGSNIGNFTPEEAIEILKGIRKVMHKDDFLLIGFDLKKNIDVMVRAYSDSEGVTAKFNLNLLERINNELGATFASESFVHRAHYNPELGAMESFLISMRNQDVFIKDLNKTFHFDEFEPIHLEYSFKYLEKEIDTMSLNGGFMPVQNFKDSQLFFLDALWRV
jgi:L-histidine N-alpha-methyltransferase